MNLDVLNGLRPETRWRPLEVPRALRDCERGGLVNLGVYLEPVKRDPLKLIATIEPYDNAGHWLHLSVSRQARMPDWGDLVMARDAMGYREWLFVQILAPRSAWLNVHQYCLHLWHRLDTDTIPPAVWYQEGADGRAYGRHR